MAAALTAAGGLLVWAVVATWSRGDDPGRAAPVLALGGTWLVAAALCARRRPTAVVAGLVVVAWLAATVLPEAVMWHRGVLVALLLGGGRWWPRTWTARAVVVLAAIASVLAWPWAASGAAAGLSVAVVVAAAVEGRAHRVSVVRLPPWRWAVVLAALTFAAPPLAADLGLDRDRAVIVLVVFCTSLAVVAALVVLATRRPASEWATDLAVDLRFPAREALERALAPTRGDAADLALEVEVATAAAARLRDRLAAEQEHLTDAVTATRESRDRLAAADAVERRRLRDELDAVTAGRLQDVIGRVRRAAVATHGPEVAAPLRTALAHLEHAVGDLDAIGAGLVPAPVANGIGAALADLRDATPLPVALDLPDEDTLAGVPPAVAVCVYYVAAEALANAVKHAGDCSVLVQVRVDGSVSLLVADDGTGGRRDGGGRGLTGMEERAAEIGGALVIESVRDRGTSVRLVVPLARERA